MTMYGERASISAAEAFAAGNGCPCRVGDRSVVLGNWCKPESDWSFVEGLK